MAQVTLYHGQINHLLRSPAGDVPRHFINVGRNTARLARAGAPKETGTLASNISMGYHISRNTIVVEAGVLGPMRMPPRSWGPRQVRPSVAQVAVWQDKGHGPISAKRGGRLTFKYKGVWYSVASTSGYPRTGFLTDSFKRACPYPVRELTARGP